MTRLLVLVLLLLVPWAAGAIEIATGRMLGPEFDQRSFYVRSGNREWQKTYTGPQYRPDAAGRLMNLRLAQALYHDEWLTEFPFDPDQNTDAVIAALDTYKLHGVMAITVSLQGGNAGYAKEFGAISRATAAAPGPGKGMLVSAFQADGSLKQPWKARLLRLARALNQRGMILDLAYFYQGQDEVLAGPEAIRQAVQNATDFLIDNNLRNVIIEIVNEAEIKGFDHDRYIERNLADLIRLARSRFDAKKAAFRLPISASSAPAMRLLPAIVETADLTMIHGNGKTPEFKRRRVGELFADTATPGPVYMNEDNNGRDATFGNLQLELASLDAVWDAGGSWGYMPWRQAQMFPFRWYLPTGDEPEPAYFRAVLSAIRGKVLRDVTPPASCPVDEDFTAGKTAGVRPQDAGSFGPDGWRVTTEQTQIKYDLGRFYPRGYVELEVRGPMSQPQKRTLFAAWNEEAAADGDRKSQVFFQLRLQQGGMMLRLTNRAAGRSFEGRTASLDWKEGWHTVRGEWDTTGGDNRLWLNGALLRSGQFGGDSPGFRWLFIGKDNYQKQFSVPGLVYRRLKVCVYR